MATIKTTISIAVGLIRSGEWRTLVYRAHMKWKGIDLGYVSLEDLGLSEERALFHGSSGGPGLDSILRTLRIHPDDQILDLGCGKAGAMLTMAKYPFARVDGVEISQMLIEVARENLRRMKVSKSALYHSDAAEFTDIDRYTFFYMYHPFPRIVTERVLQNMVRSLERCPRRLTLVFNNSVDHDLILTYGFLVEAEFKQLGTTRPAYVYRAPDNSK